MNALEAPESLATDSRLSRLVQRALTGFDDADRYERRSRALRLRKMLAVGALVYAAFIPVDLLYSASAGTPVSFFLGTRAIGIAALVAAWLWLRKNRTPSQSALLTWDLAVVGIVAITQALFVVGAGGLESAAVNGILLILVARAIAIADPWQRGLVLTGAPALLYAGTLGLAALIDPTVLGTTTSERWLADLAVEAGMLVGMTALVVTGSHFAWQLRRELFRARRFGRYRLRERLSGGGMGEVWIAENQPMRQEVALKILPLASGKDAEMVARFEREVLATSRLRHPNTVRIFDFGMSEDGYWYYSMELLEGETLAALVEREGPIEPDRAVRLVEQAASAIAEAHRRKVIHRDIKPSNLFLCNPADGEDFVKVLDFGVARIVGADLSGAAGDWGGGTPLYVSPEVARGQLADERSDVYGLGCTLYYLLTGRPPFTGSDPTELLVAHVNETPQTVGKVLGRHIPRVLESLIARCLEKDASRRYQTANEFLDALQAVDRRISGPAPAATKSRAVNDWVETTDVDLTVLEP